MALLLTHPPALDDVSACIHQGTYERNQTSYLGWYCREGHVVLDLGANIGYYTLLMAEAVGPKGRVLAFEPDRKHFQLLLQSVRNNRLNNVIAFHAAVSDYDGTAILHKDGGRNWGDNRLWHHENGNAEEMVRCLKLDNFIKEDRIDLIKMDIQGSEPRALAGMIQLIKRQPRLALFIEFWKVGLAAAGESAADLHDQLIALGFTIFIIPDRGNMFRASREQVLGKGDCLNLVCLKGHGL